MVQVGFDHSSRCRVACALKFSYSTCGSDRYCGTPVLFVRYLIPPKKNRGHKFSFPVETLCGNTWSTAWPVSTWLASRESQHVPNLLGREAGRPWEEGGKQTNNKYPSPPPPKKLKKKKICRIKKMRNGTAPAVFPPPRRKGKNKEKNISRKKTKKKEKG